MREHYMPDVWQILKVVHPEGDTTYHVHAGWYGGFANSNTWRVSRPIKSMTNEGGKIVVNGKESSRYTLDPMDNRETSSLLMSSIPTINGGTIEVINIEEVKL